MEELLHYKKRYDFQWVDIKNNTFSANKKWTLEFLDRYSRDVNVPLRVMIHPTKIDDEILKAMKKAPVWCMQMGIESLREDIRRDLLGRKETNQQIKKALSILEQHKIRYTIDHMFGLPGQTDQDLEFAAKTYSHCGNAMRITPFWLQYLHGTDLLEIADGMGIIDQDVRKAAVQGLDHHYIYQGSVTDKEQVNNLRCFHVLFRLVPIVGPKTTDWLIRKKRYRLFKYLPLNPLITMADLFSTFFFKDLTAITYIKTYFIHMTKMLRNIFSLTV